MDRTQRSIKIRETSLQRSSGTLVKHDSLFRHARRGSATVEFAILSPLFVTLVLTAAQSAFNLDTANTLHSTIRQAGRLASMDASERELSGQSRNEKVILDIRNQLIAEGLPGQLMDITITPADGDGPFDLTDPANDLQLFRITVDVPYSALNSMGVFPANREQLRASVVFRKGRTTLVN